MNVGGRKPVAPSRPPPPKVGGMSFSFKALEEENDEDEELTVFTGKFDKQVSEEKEKQSRSQQQREKLASDSRSPGIQIPTPGSGSATPRPAVKTQNSLDKLLDIKEKIQDTIAKKKEEFLSESFGSSKERDADSFVTDDSQSIGGDSELMLSLEEPGNEHFEMARDNDIVSERSQEITEAKSDMVDEPLADMDDDEQLEISEEYFSPNSEDFSELPGVQPILRQRKRLQKFRKIKPIVPPAPVSMSKLNQNVPEKLDIEENNSDHLLDQENAKEPEKQTTPDHTVQTMATKIPLKKLTGGIAFLFLYMIIPLPSYISGLIAGVLLTSGCWMLYLWITEEPKPRKPIPDDPPLHELPPLPVPEMKDPKGEDGCYKGWMNEIMDYETETYSINMTHSVHVHLEGTTLRLRRPKTNIPKRAMWDDQKNPNPQFIHQRHFDIEGSKILLLPPGLVKKRLWSKKYPVCVALAKVRQKTARTDSAPQSPVVSVASSELKMTNSNSADTVNGFEVISEEKCEPSVLYLFARTCHEKEQWYRRFVAAAKGMPLKNHILEIRNIVENSNRPRRSSSSDSLRHKRQNSSDSLSSVGTTSSAVDDIQTGDLKHFIRYMARLIPRDQTSSPSSPTHSLSGKEKEAKGPESRSTTPTTAGSKTVVCDSALLPLNALLGRCFFDFLGDQYWADKVKEKLQKKLSKIHIPYFIEELQISEISLGSEVPVIRRANKPYLDENGFWIDLDLTYSGKFNMTIETKVNLLKLKHIQPARTSSIDNRVEKKKSAVTDSEEEDSAESSTDEDEDTSSIAEDGTSQSGGTGKKIMKYINKITASKYFQSATENRYIKKAMTEVSNTRLILTVEVQKLSGTLAVNIPPPPSDRLWYGFRGNPQLWLVARPKVGEREVTMSHITDWIEKKLTLEFQHVLVMPNMDDLVVPILSAGNDAEPQSPVPQSRSGSEV